MCNTEPREPISRLDSVPEQTDTLTHVHTPTQEAQEEGSFPFHFQVPDPKTFAIKNTGGGVREGLHVSSGR